MAGDPGRTVEVMVNRFDTHEVTNQAGELGDHDSFTSNRALHEALQRHGGSEATAELASLGERAGSLRAREWARLANENRPELRTHDRFGHRLDVVEYHPAYHQLMELSIGAGSAASAWFDRRDAAHVIRAAKFLVTYGVESGHSCPVSMTNAVVPALRHQPDVAAELEPLLASGAYDPSNRVLTDKAGITAGMAMTEKQGGSDVRANTTVATPIGGSGGPGGEYELVGHKWFCSAPMSDGFLVLAQAPGGLSCFWMPRWLPDGTRNAIRIQRLKDKLGDRSNASSEIELAGAWARMVGEEGRGVRTIIEMVNSTRLDCSLGSASVMRRGVEQATWHTHNRSAFGAVLDEQPLMANVLADLCVESEAATVMAMRLAATFDAADTDPREELLQRLLTPVAKYWTCKRAPVHAAESLECLGGMGYVEESDMPRVFRQSPLNGVWEGSGNVICLDVLRAMQRSPESVMVFLDEVERAAGTDARLDAATARLRKELDDGDSIESRARGVVEQMALVMQGTLLVQHAPHEVADAFCATRLRDGGPGVFGTLPPDPSGFTAIVDRHRPVPSA